MSASRVEFQIQCERAGCFLHPFYVSVGQTVYAVIMYVYIVNADDFLTVQSNDIDPTIVVWLGTACAGRGLRLVGLQRMLVPISFSVSCM